MTAPVQGARSAGREAASPEGEGRCRARLGSTRSFRADAALSHFHFVRRRRWCRSGGASRSQRGWGAGNPRAAPAPRSTLADVTATGSAGNAQRLGHQHSIKTPGPQTSPSRVSLSVCLRFVRACVWCGDCAWLRPPSGSRPFILGDPPDPVLPAGDAAPGLGPQASGARCLCRTDKVSGLDRVNRPLAAGVVSPLLASLLSWARVTMLVCEQRPPGPAAFCPVLSPSLGP